MSDIDVKRTLQAYYDKIFQDGFLVNLHVGIWSMSATLRPEDLKLETQLPDIFKLGKKLLISSAVYNKFKQVESSARNYLYKNSFPFPISEAHFIPKKKVGEVILRLNDFRETFTKLTNSFIIDYDKLKKETLDRWSDYKDQLEGYYPTIDQIKHKFKFSISTFELAMPKELAEVKIEEILAKEQATEEAKKIVLGEMRAQHEQSIQQIEQFGSKAIEVIRGEVVKVCEALRDRIAKRQLITTSNITSIRDMISDFKVLNFMDDKTVASELDKLQAMVSTDIDYKTDQEALTRLDNTLQSVVTNALNLTDLRDVSGAYFRPIKL